jgi:hypothetical protein
MKLDGFRWLVFGFPTDNWCGAAMQYNPVGGWGWCGPWHVQNFNENQLMKPTFTGCVKFKRTNSSYPQVPIDQPMKFHRSRCAFFSSGPSHQDYGDWRCGGTPKSSSFIRFSIINHPFWHNVGKTIINDPPNHQFYKRYKPFTNGLFIIVLPALPFYGHLHNLATGCLPRG